MKHLEEGMILYHGSYCPVENPDLSKCAQFKDFGRGFYLTSSKEQAKNFSKISSSRAKESGVISANERFGFISFYRLKNISELKTFYFDFADSDWLHCVVAHRKTNAFPELKEKMQPFDVISGKIANDDTNTTIVAYMSNLYGQMGSAKADDFCISLLLPERLKDQFCFRTKFAVDKLEFLKTEKVSLESHR